MGTKLTNPKLIGTVRSRVLSSAGDPHVIGGKDDSLTDQAQSGLDTFTRKWLNVDINQIKE